MPIALALAVFLPMLGEGILAARHERAQRARGGIEAAGDVYRLMQAAYPGAFLAMIGEGVARGNPRPGVLIAGVVVFAGAKALKWWAIHTLGSSWTFRVIVVRGTTLVRCGPYRFVRHPNYLAVVGELVGVALMSGAILAGPAAVALFGALLLKRIAVEERALAQAEGPALDAILR